MASIYRFSFENDIIPEGVSITSGSIWSGQGRNGIMTSALTSVSRTASPVQASVVVALPNNTSGVRTSFYTKASDNITYPSVLATAGNWSFQLKDSVTAEILYSGVSAITQDVTVVEDNRWNLVRFSADFNGSVSTGSLEFNGIRVDITHADVTTGINTIALKGIAGKLSCIDDVGVNDNLGSITADKDVPNAIRGFVGGLVEDGDIQNWQQNVASLFPLSYNHESQGRLLYVPSVDKIITTNVSTPAYTVSENTFTVLNAQSFVTESTFVETETTFSIQEVVYNDSDGLVYFMGKQTVGSTTHFAHKTYDPITNLTSSVTWWTGGFDLTPPTWIGVAGSTTGYEYKFRDVLVSTYCPLNSKIYSLVVVYNPYYPHVTTQTNPTSYDDYVENKSWVQMIVFDPKTGFTELSYKYYGVWTHFYSSFGSATSCYVKPDTKMIWNPSDQNLLAWCPKFTGEGYGSYYLRSIEPESLIIKKNKSISFIDSGSLITRQTDENSIPDGLTPKSDLVYCDINNSAYMALYTSTYGTSSLYRIDLTSRTGSVVFPKNVGSMIRRLEYSPSRNAVFCLGEVESYMFDPIKETANEALYRQYGTGGLWATVCESGSLLSGSIIEPIPLFNVKDSVYSPKNAAIVSVSDKKVYSLKGSMESSVVNALLSPDSLKAGATASGDICTLKVAKPTGSFTNLYQYEGFNIRVDNASSLETASLLMGIREAGVNYALGTPVVTWPNSSGSHVRSVFTPHNAGSTKWSASQFEAVQFYMEASD